MSEMHTAAARYVGKRVLRKEDARLLTGRGIFTDDVSYPGMLHAAFVRSPIARGTIRSIDCDTARSLPGVHAVYTAEDFAAFDIEMVSFFNVSPPPGPKVYPLANGRVAHVGDPVAIILADSRALAEDAAALIFVEIDSETPVVTMAEARAEGAAKVHPDLESNIAAQAGFPRDEELEALLADAPHMVGGHFVHQRISQAPMEARGCVAVPDGDGSRMTVHLSCQSPQMSARTLNSCFKSPPAEFRVIAKDVGGAFGLKTQPWREEISTIAAARLIGRPVKWIEDRFESLTASNPARAQEANLRLALDKDGHFLASHLEYHFDNGAYPYMPDENIAVAMFCWGAYKIPAFQFDNKAWHTNTMGLAAYRGPWAMESFVREVLIDDAARELGIEPVELRRRNLVRKEDQPTASSMGLPLEDISPAECLDLLMTEIDLAAFRKEQAEAREQGRYLGIGMAAYIEPTGGSSIPVLASDTAHIRIEPSGKVNAILSTHSQGHGTETTMAQVIAESLGVDIADVAIHESDSSAGGFGAGASGSRQAIAGGGASIRAATMLTEKLRTLAAHVMNAAPGDISIEDGMVHSAGAKPMSRSLKDLAEIAYNEPARLPEGMEAGLEVVYRYQPPPITFASAAHAAIVEVDIETGFVAIKRWLVSEDCGVVINPGVVEGQVTGGLAQAIGTVLLEEIRHDAAGNVTTGTFKDYLLPTIHDVPEFEFLHYHNPSKAEGGFRGVGEGGAIIGPPTLVNAIADALSPFGVKCHELPLTPSRILELVERAQAGR